MKSTPRNNLIRMTEIKDEERILKATREEQLVMGIPIRLSASFSSETLQVRREWLDVFKVKGKNLQPRIFYPARVSVRLEGKRVLNHSNSRSLAH